MLCVFVSFIVYLKRFVCTGFEKGILWVCVCTFESKKHLNNDIILIYVNLINHPKVCCCVMEEKETTIILCVCVCVCRNNNNTRNNAVSRTMIIPCLCVERWMLCTNKVLFFYKKTLLLKIFMKREKRQQQQ